MATVTITCNPKARKFKALRTLFWKQHSFIMYYADTGSGPSPRVSSRYPITLEMSLVFAIYYFHNPIQQPPSLNLFLNVRQLNLQQQTELNSIYQNGRYEHINVLRALRHPRSIKQIEQNFRNQHLDFSYASPANAFNSLLLFATKGVPLGPKFKDPRHDPNWRYYVEYKVKHVNRFRVAEDVVPQTRSPIRKMETISRSVFISPQIKKKTCKLCAYSRETHDQILNDIKFEHHWHTYGTFSDVETCDSLGWYLDTLSCPSCSLTFSCAEDGALKTN